MIRSTNFQILVWKEITIIYLVTYKQLLVSISSVICSKNPFLLVIPWHRVVKNNGKVGGYKDL